MPSVLGHITLALSATVSTEVEQEWLGGVVRVTGSFSH